MKKIFLIGLILIFMSVFSFAASFNSTDYSMDVTVNVGWTMLPNGLQAQDNSNWLKKCGIEYMYIWNPMLKEYLGYKLVNDTTKVISGTTFNGMTDDLANYYNSNYLLGSNWVYSKKGCTFKAIWGAPTVGTWNNTTKASIQEKIKLPKGWSFLTINPYILGLTFYEIFSNCNISGVNSWNQATQQWNNSNSTEALKYINSESESISKIDQHTVGTVIAIKADNECYLNYGYSGSGNIAPPSLPGSNDDVIANTCNDSDNGSYYLKGTTTGYNSNNQMSTMTDYCGATNSGNPEDKRYVHEYGCTENGSVYDEDYLCEFGCMNGMCAISETQPVVCETDYFTPLTNDVTCSVEYNNTISTCIISASNDNGHQCTPQPEVRLNVPADKQGYSPVEGLTGTYSGVNCNSTETAYNSSQFFFNCDNKN